MRNTAPISLGIMAVAGLFAIVAAGVAFVLYGYGVVASLVIGGVVGSLGGLALLLGWREPLAGPHGVAKPVAKAAPAPSPALAPVPVAQDAAPTPAPAPVAAAPAVPSGDGKPVFLAAAREGGPDNLKQIKGVGPKLESTLHGMGIFHFDQIASWGPQEQAWMDDNLEGFKGRATRDDWVNQAKTLAAGGETAFSQKVDKGGVY